MPANSAETAEYAPKIMRLPSPFNFRAWTRLEFKVFALIALTTLATAAAVVVVSHVLYYRLMVDSMRDRTRSVNQYARHVVDPESFKVLNSRGDETLPVYQKVQGALNAIRQIANVRYLYSAKRDASGSPVYLIDGLDPDAEDFRHVGDPIEPEILSELNRCLAGEIVESDDIMLTEWGPIFITCWPVHDASGKTVGAIVMEFDAKELYSKSVRVTVYSVLIATGLALLFIAAAAYIMRRISEPYYKKLAYIDYLTGLNNRTAFELDLRERERNGLSPGLALVAYDLNKLKSVNDQLGHAAGDIYIKKMAAFISSSELGQNGVNYRIGGDEFVTVVENRSLPEIEAQVDEMFRISRASGAEGWFEFSYGVALYEPSTDRDLHDTLVRADRAMYAFKKRCGENRG